MFNGGYIIRVSGAGDLAILGKLHMTETLCLVQAGRIEEMLVSTASD